MKVTDNARSRDRRARRLLTVITLLACAVRVPLLSHGLWRDEGSTFLDVTAPTLAGTLHEISLTELTPPGYFLFMRGWVGLLGTSELVLKLPSFLCGVALVPATYALGRFFGSRAAALLAAVFAAFSLTAITLSTEARAYTLCALLAAIATSLALRYLSSNGGGSLLLAYVGVATSLAYVHYTGVVSAASFAFGTCAFAVRRCGRLRLALFWAANAIVAVAISPWLPHAARARQAAFLEPGGGTSGVGRFIEQFGFALPVDFMHVQYAVVLLVVLAAASVRYFARTSHAAPVEEVRFVAASLALFAATTLETLLSLHEQRYMFAFTPLANVLAATVCISVLAPAFAWLRRRTALLPPLRAAFGLALLATALSGVSSQARAFERSYGADRSGIRRLVAEAFSSLDRRTLVVVAPDYLAPTMAYYLRERPDVDVAGVPQWDSPAHPRCCGLSWTDARMVDLASRRIVATARRHYDAVAFVWDLNAYDEGAVRYSKVFEIRNRLLRALPVVAERRYEGTKERVGMTLLRVPRR